MTTIEIERAFDGTAEQYADPNCEMCEGAGLVSIPITLSDPDPDQELCLCVRTGRNEAHGEMLMDLDRGN